MLGDRQAVGSGLNYFVKSKFRKISFL